MNEWLMSAAEALEAATGAPSRLTSGETEALLDAARVAAHESGAKLNAPLLCFLIGRASAGGERSVEELVEVVRLATATGSPNGAA